mmetsp:Transcript_60405/g.155688  ORF Transcript_60405/g.155688 Transcript_60405/m.155688 type:complete len:219 (-) Transcript_60405:442-1098(-)
MVATGIGLEPVATTDASEWASMGSPAMTMSPIRNWMRGGVLTATMKSSASKGGASGRSIVTCRSLTLLDEDAAFDSAVISSNRCLSASDKHSERRVPATLLPMIASKELSPRTMVSLSAPNQKPASEVTRSNEAVAACSLLCDQQVDDLLTSGDGVTRNHGKDQSADGSDEADIASMKHISNFFHAGYGHCHDRCSDAHMRRDDGDFHRQSQPQARDI